MKKTLFLILLFSFAFATSACVPEFKETIRVQVSGQDGYVIPRVEVWATYQESATTGVFVNGSFVPKYAETKHLLTNELGEVNISVVNRERDPNRLDCTVVIHTRYFGEEREHPLDLNNKPPIFRIKLNTKLVKVSVTSDGKPVDAEIFFENFGNLSVKNGVAHISLPVGRAVSGYALLRDVGVKHYFEETITQESGLLKIGLRKKDVVLKVVNEQGVPLPFTVNLSGQVYEAPSGQIELKLYSGRYDAIFEAEGNTFLREIDTSVDEEVVVLDVNAPEVFALDSARVSDEEVLITFRAVDRGQRSSGISYIKLFVDGKEVPVSFDGTQYSAQLKITKNASLKIEAKDKRGNIRVVEAKLIYTPPSSTEITIDEKPPGENDGTLNIIALIVGVVALLIVLGILYVIKIMYF